MLRFIHNTKHDNTSKLKGDLSRAELNKSMTTLVRLVQQDYFSQEISLLKRGKHLPKSSKILSLDPFIDEECLLRVGERLKNSQESYDKIHPILLPSTHNFTRAIIKYEHVRNMHAGTQTILAAVPKRYWPINGKNTVKKIIHDCLKCFRANPRNVLPKMGNLPEARVTPARPFLSVGIDFAGPIVIKAGMLRKKRKKIS